MGGGNIKKTFSHIYQEVISLDNLFQAWDEFKKGKRKKVDVGLFERHLEDNIFQLHQELVTKTYKHASYTGFYVRDPKVRHIHKAIVRDRITHHALFRVLNPIFETTFIADSYSCRVGKGTHLGFKQLVNYTRKISQNFTQPGWALKCDIRKFFDSVDHEILLTLIKRKLADEDLVWLITEIVNSYQNHVTHPECDTGAKGIPIGNFTSQLFANIYLNELDQFVKHKLKVKYYLRYADDFIILGESQETVYQYTSILVRFLKTDLKLDLHPNKVSIRKLNWGIDFVGYVARPYYQVLRTKTKRRIFRKVKEKTTALKQEKITIKSFNQTIASYLGVLKHANTYQLEKDLRNQLWYLLTSG